MSFFESNKKWENEANKLRAIVAKTHNACHDYAMAHPYRTIPYVLRVAYSEAELTLHAHRAKESARYFYSSKQIDARQSAWETAMGMRGYSGSAAEFEDRKNKANK